MKDISWIYAELNQHSRYFASYPVARTIVDSTRISTDQALAAQVRNCPVDNLRLDAAVSSCVGGEVGLWFHAGWHDQASLEVFECKKGNSQLFAPMLAKLDQLQPDESGDMVFGFASIDSNWVLLVELSRERQVLRSEIRATSDEVAEIVFSRLAKARQMQR